MTKKVTITDLAARAKVSVTTVSQILNGKAARFSSKTVEKVKQLQKEMGYVPDFNAQSLIRKSGRTIGVLVPNLNNPFFSRFLRGIEDEAIKQDYVPLIFGSNNSQEQETHYLFESVRRAADGMIIASAVSDINYIDNILNQNGIPYILIDQAPVVKGDRVDANNEKGGALLADYLIKNGHTNVTVVCATKPTLNLQERLQGFVETYKKNGTPIPDANIITTDMTKKGGYDATAAALATKPNAIFAINDEVAIGLYRGLEEAGLKIPEDISIVGYDDIDLGEYIYPKLTTVHQPAFEMGTKAAQMIINRIEDQNEPIQQVSLPVSLVERDSVRAID
ncbi:LacI family DNA-binding transcriptional regulator [Lentilactobacillus otakiensis]|jgi:LacI family transcriptional regulator|uniref:Ribose operon repressor n=1 Tax=Lentilactobacillus otakiensis DSM 19908 = JCM 15040 TaxID=1423780 RepID=S4NNM5_9LACO|nr:LacI family DNA-binding transcriptional regulator [Lentilactobacillus otakiensis]KRL08578.1 lacI family transcriptional regulator [Lentilactobacillus otakiensis DSM 19908 = JCM 15040]MBZ3777640.1 LacI family transcriptional regulator [Lentilactobacillus otakiensis]MDV3518681.1 LacI family DNA-binding transcriptional regulator [Lentilactobacillus otakiensis]GAD17441.1 ribose operon repressor [Lentilactobacillus otakiensis DSM 19908 = JCM 15040]